MLKTTETHWIWTEKAGRLADERGMIGAKAGKPLMERTKYDNYIYRKSVPEEWVNRGYVEEAKQEQVELWG